MPILTILSDEAAIRLPFPPGSSVRAVLEDADVRVPWGCLGNGACGLCRVQVEAGRVREPDESEALMLSAEEIDRGVRLACRLVADDDLRIRLLATVARPVWRDLPDGFSPVLADASFNSPNAAVSTNSRGGYGVAVDLGTTHIRLSLCGLESRERVAGRLGPNPQARYGTDVITRLTAASDDADVSSRIARMTSEALHTAVSEMCKTAHVDKNDVVRVHIVGNTPMLTLLAEGDPSVLLRPASWSERLLGPVVDARAFAEALDISPDADVHVASPLAGFVGSDLLAGVVATGLLDGDAGLLIDFGTNSEIALWDGRVLRVSSAAGGPAFEGHGFHCGMPAREGAIQAVRPNGESRLRFEVIGGGEPKGMCGSGLLDLIACLIATGELSETGRLAEPHATHGFLVDGNGLDIRLTGKDVDMFQRAKAGIGVGVRTLLGMAEMSAADLSRVCVCGAFGRQLDVANAQLVGLIPRMAPEHVELCGDTALAGCEQLLLSEQHRARLVGVRNSAEIVNLAQVPGFDMMFLEDLYLRPQG